MVIRVKYRIFSGIILIIIMAAFQNSIKAQLFHTQPLVANPRFDQMWNFRLSVPYSPQFKGFYVKVKVIHQNREAFRAQSIVFTVQQGKHQLIAISPAMVDKSSVHFSPAFQSQLNKNGGYLPYGEYVITYYLSGLTTSLTGSNYTEEIFEYTEFHTVESNTPPLLVSVYDRDTIDSSYPVFVWLPAVLHTEWPIRYGIRITEVLSGQSPESSIQQNKAIYNQKTLNACYASYPLFAEKLISGKWYAWQITAHSGTNYLHSEVWSFYYNDKTLRPRNLPTPHKSFAELHKQMLGNCYEMRNKELLFCKNARMQGVMRYKITNAKGNDVSESFAVKNIDNEDNPLQILPGRNQYLLFAQKNLAEDIYFLHVSSENEPASFIQFRYKAQGTSELIRITERIKL